MSLLSFLRQGCGLALFPIALISQPVSAQTTTLAPGPSAAQAAPPSTAASVATPAAAPCAQFDQTVARYQARFQTRMLNWSAKALGDVKARTAFYPFSGPDVVTLLSLYPNAEHYLMVADQTPEYDQVESAAAGGSRSQASAFECQMLAGFAQRGYYLTNDLIGKNGPKPRFLTLLHHNIAFAGARIESQRVLHLAPDGSVGLREAGQSPHGVRFALRNRDGRTVTLDYLRIDLSNPGIEKTPGALQAMSRHAREAVLLKSASHLLQKPYFSVLAEALVSNAQWITQDETGLDINPLSAGFNLTLYGKFVAAHPLWAANESSRRLAQYYATHTRTEDLPFYLGYEKVGGSILMVGRRKP
ncbi:MAG: hypothetical protein ACO26U_05380 [Burkholderiaceae bacterium]